MPRNRVNTELEFLNVISIWELKLCDYMDVTYSTKNFLFHGDLMSVCWQNWRYRTQSTHGVATGAFRRTFHHDGKISTGWWGWGVHHYIYHHVQSCSICSSWEGRYTPPISFLPLCTLCFLLFIVEFKTSTVCDRLSRIIVEKKIVVTPAYIYCTVITRKRLSTQQRIYKKYIQYIYAIVHQRIKVQNMYVCVLAVGVSFYPRSRLSFVVDYHVSRLLTVGDSCRWNFRLSVPSSAGNWAGIHEFFDKG